VSLTRREKPRGSGVWVVTLHDRSLPKGRRQLATFSKGTPAENEKASGLFIKKIEARLVLNLPASEPTPLSPTLVQAAHRWLKVYAEPTLSASTVLGSYRPAIEKHLIPHFGPTRLVGDIKRKDVRAYIHTKRSEGLSDKAIQNHLHALSGIFRLAMEEHEDTVTSNPATGWRLKKKPEGAVFTELDLEALNLVLDAVKEIDPVTYPYLLTLARTGMRAGEALGLTFGDLQLVPSRSIHVRRSITRGIVGPPKNKKPRVVDMASDLAEVLQGLEVSAMVDGKGRPDDWIFYDPARPYAMIKKGEKALKKAAHLAGCPTLTAHDLRHLFAYIHIWKFGSDPKWVSRMLGHHSVGFTLSRYGSPEVHSDVTLADRMVQKKEPAAPDATKTRPMRRAGDNPLIPGAILERATGLEPATSGLGSRRSTS